MVQASLVVNFVIFQVGWLVAVLGAAYGYPLAGLLYATAFTAGHHWSMSVGRGPELLFVLSSAILGYAVDSALVLGGFITFPDEAWIGYPSTVWMVCLWVMFAMTLRHSLGWLRGRYLLGALFGAVGGPLAYWAGSKLGAIELVGTLRAAAAIGVAWAASMLALLRLEVLTRLSYRERTVQPVNEQ